MKRFIKSQRGFTLVELAIVLAIAGIVVAGILAAASTVSRKNRERDATRQLIQIVQNIRKVYYGARTMGSPTMAQLDSLGVFPPEMRTGTGTIVNPWGGAVTVIPISSTTFRVTFDAVPRSSCVALVLNTSASANDAGLVSINGQPPPFTVVTALSNVCSLNPVLVPWIYNLK